MRLTVSAARTRLGAVVTHVQNPNECVVLTRHGTPVAAVVSMAGLRRIWSMEDEQDQGLLRHPLYSILTARGRGYSATLEIGLNGKVVTRSEAALQMRTVQLTRAEERRILAAGGLEEVEGGELRLVEGVERVERRRWWAFWRR